MEIMGHFMNTLVMMGIVWVLICATWVSVLAVLSQIKKARGRQGVALKIRPKREAENHVVQMYQPKAFRRERKD